MESENARTVRRVSELYNALPATSEERLGSPAAAQLTAMFTEGCVFVQPAPLRLDRSDAVGHEAMVAAFDEWLGMWRSHRSEIESVEERGPRILVFTRERLEGRDGVVTETDGAAIYTFDSNRIARFEAYFDRDEARRAFEQG